MNALRLRRLFRAVPALFVLLPAVFAQGPVPRAPQELIATSSAIGYQMARDGDLVVVAYYDRQFPCALCRVFVQVSEDGGLSFALPVTLGVGVTAPAVRVAVAGDDVHVFWTQGKTRTAYSRDRGRTFSSTTVLDDGNPGTDSVLGLEVQLEPDPAGDHVYVLQWTRLASGAHDLTLVASHDGGVTWSPALLVDQKSTINGYDSIDLAAAGTTVHVVYTQQLGLLYRRSVDGGATLSSPAVRLSGAVIPGVTDPPDLELDGQELAATFLGSVAGKNDLRVAFSADAGSTWAPPSRVGNTNAAVSDVTSFDALFDGGRYSAAWSENRDMLGYRQLFVGRSLDRGASFDELEVDAFQGGWMPSLDGLGENLVIGFEGGFTTQYTAVTASVDGGLTWTPAIAIGGAGNPGMRETRVGYDPATEDVVTLHERVGSLQVSGFSLCDEGSVTIRGGGANPTSLSGPVPILGADWTASVDLSQTGHAMACLMGYLTPLAYTLPGGQVVLVNVLDPSGELLQVPPAGGSPTTFTLAVPNVPSLCGVSLSAQALHFGGVQPFALSNALDLVAAGL